MAISEHALMVMLALHPSADNDGTRTLGPEVLAQPNGAVVLAAAEKAGQKGGVAPSAMHIKGEAPSAMHIKGEAPSAMHIKGQAPSAAHIKGEAPSAMHIKGEAH